MPFPMVLPVVLAPVWPPDFRSVLYFLTGAFFGFTVCSLVIAAIFLGREKKREKRRIDAGECLKSDEVKALIKKKQDLLPEIAAVAGNSYFRAAADLSFELLHEVAAHYYPDRKYPIYELTPQEVLDLSKYITARLEKILNGRIVRRFRKYRISTIVDIVNRKRDFDNNKLMRLNKRFQISKILGTISMIANAANPITWLKRSAIKPLMSYVTKEAAARIIAIVGEETDKLYSRKLFAPADDAENAVADMLEASAEAGIEPEAEPAPEPGKS